MILPPLPSEVNDLFQRCCIAASKVEVHKADVSFTYSIESEEVQGIVRAVFEELGLLP